MVWFPFNGYKMLPRSECFCTSV